MLKAEHYICNADKLAEFGSGCSYAVQEELGHDIQVLGITTLPDTMWKGIALTVSPFRKVLETGGSPSDVMSDTGAINPPLSLAGLPKIGTGVTRTRGNQVVCVWAHADTAYIESRC